MPRNRFRNCLRFFRTFAENINTPVSARHDPEALKRSVEKLKDKSCDDQNQRNIDEGHRTGIYPGKNGMPLDRYSLVSIAAVNIQGSQ